MQNEFLVTLASKHGYCLHHLGLLPSNFELAKCRDILNMPDHSSRQDKRTAAVSNGVYLCRLFDQLHLQIAYGLQQDDWKHKHAYRIRHISLA